MEAIEDLKRKLAKFVAYCEQTERSTSFTELDEAKVQGLIAFRELLQQVSRSQVVLLNVAKDRRYELSQDSLRQARNAAKSLHAEVASKPAGELTSLETKPSSEPTQKKPKAKKAKK